MVSTKVYRVTLNTDQAIALANLAITLAENITALKDMPDRLSETEDGVSLGQMIEAHMPALLDIIRQMPL